MKTSTIIILAITGLAAGFVLALPSAAASHCGTGIVENNHEPLATTADTTPLVRVTFDDTGTQCGVSTIQVIVDGTDVSGLSSDSSSSSPQQYTVSYTPASATSPGGGYGSHSVSVTLTETCCNNAGSVGDVGTASWSYSVVPPVIPRTSDNPNGTCTLWNDANNNGIPDSSETPIVYPCPNPRTQPAPGGQTTIYDDKDNDGVVDPGEHILTTPNAKTKDNPDGTCTLYNDANANNAVDSGETIQTYPCPNPRTTTGPGGSVVLYDDKDNDATMDPGEELARSPNLRTMRKGDGNCVAYDDRNANNLVDSGETLLTYPCPNPKTYTNSDGRVTLYDDKNNNNAVDSSEAITTVGMADADGDNVPDSTELEICGPPDNRNLLDTLSPNAGRCASSTDYVAPTTFGGVNLPTQPIPGPDLDSDGFPETITVKRQRVTFEPFEPGVVKIEDAPDLVLPVDSNDNDPNVPALSTITVPLPVVTSWTFGADADGDDVPVSVTLQKKWYTFDRRSATPISTSDAPSQTFPLDSNDADKNVPVQSVVGPFKIPTDAYGVDVDGDRVPGTVTVTFLDVTIDRSASSPITTGTHTETYELDPDDGTRGAPPVSLDPYDGDRDDLPDAIEPILCGRQNDNRPEDGVCPNPNDYQAPAAVPNPWRRS